MEYLEILIKDINKIFLDKLIGQDLKIINDAIISSHFFDKFNQKNLEYSEISSLANYFSIIPNTCNIFVNELDMGEKLSNVMVVMSFDDEQGDVTLNFSEDEIHGSNIYDSKEKVVKIVVKLKKIIEKYGINEIEFGYESIIDSENIVLNISNDGTKIVNEFKGRFAEAVKLAYN